MDIEYSKVDGEPTHVVLRTRHFKPGRLELTAPSELLQVAAITAEPNREYPAHKHLPVERQTVGTQEAWVVVSGCVRVNLYDIDDTHLRKTLLWQGDCLLTLRGGHDYTIGSDGAQVLEFKTGPYFGVEADKEPIQ